MEPTKRKTWVEVLYWDCGIPEHRHKTESVAIACIEKNRIKKARRLERPTIGIRRERWLAAMHAVVTGATWKEAGEIIGVTGEQTRRIVHKIMRMSLHQSRFSGEMPKYDKYDVYEIRAHADFWLARIKVMAKEWNIPETKAD